MDQFENDFRTMQISEQPQLIHSDNELDIITDNEDDYTYKCYICDDENIEILEVHGQLIKLDDFDFKTEPDKCFCTNCWGESTDLNNVVKNNYDPNRDQCSKCFSYMDVEFININNMIYKLSKLDINTTFIGSLVCQNCIKN